MLPIMCCLQSAAGRAKEQARVVASPRSTTPNGRVLLAQSQSGSGVSALMEQATQQFNKGDYQSAIASWTQVIIANPSRSIANEALVNRSKAYLVINQPSLALADLENCRYEPNQIDLLAGLWLLKGTALLQNKQYSESIAAFNQSERLRANNPILYSNRSVAYQAIGKLDLAKADIIKAIKLQPNFSNYYNLAVLQRLSGNPQDCYNILSQMITKSQPYVQLFLQRGLCAAALGKHDEAISDMLRAIKLDPSNVDAIQQIGVSLAAKGEREGAKQYLLKAASIRLSLGQAQEYQKLLEIIARLNQ